MTRLRHLPLSAFLMFLLWITGNASHAISVTQSNISVSSPNVTIGPTGQKNAVFVVSLDAANTNAVKVDYATTDGTATVANGDYASTSGTLTIPANATSKNVLVPVYGNNNASGLTFTLNLSNPNRYGAIAQGTGTATIKRLPSVTIDSPLISVGPNSNTSLGFTVQISSVENFPVHVDYATSDGTDADPTKNAVDGTDYSAASGTVNFPAGSNGAVVNVTILKSSNLGTKSFNIALSNPVNAVLGTPSTGTGTITTLVEADINNVSVNVGPNVTKAAPFKVTLSQSPTSNVSIDYTTNDGTAHAPADYSTTSGTLTFAPGSPVTQFISVPVLANSTLGTKKFTVSLSNPNNAILGKATGTGTITTVVQADLSGPGTVNVGPTGGASAVFTVTLSQAAGTGTPVSVDYTTQDGSATAGTDYTTTTGTLTIPAGSSSGTISVPVLSTASFTGSSFTVKISNPKNALIGNNTATATIARVPAVSIADTTVTVGPDTPGTATFVLTLTSTSTSDVTGTYTTSDGSAKDPADYTGTQTGTFDIPANSLTGSITVPVNNTKTPGTSTFTVTIANPVNAVLGTPTTATATITRVPDVTIANSSTIVGPDAAGSISFTVTLSASSSSDVTVTYNTSGGNAVPGTDYTAQTNQTLTILAGHLTGTITVPVNNTNSTSSSNFTVTLSNPVNAVLGTPASATGTINRVPDVQISDATATVGPDVSGVATFTVTLSAISSQDVTVQYDTADGTAKSGTDYNQVVAGSVTIAAGLTSNTINIPVYKTKSTAASNFTVTLSNPVNAVLGAKTTGTASITRVPDVTIANNSTTVGPDAAGSITFTVTLSAAASSSVSVDYATTNGSATAGTDYTTTSGTLTFTPPQTTATITVPVLATPSTATSSFTVTLSNPVNAVLGTPASATGTINRVPDVQIADATAYVTQESQGGAAINFTVSLSAISSLDVTVPYSATDGTAKAGVDYAGVANGAQITIPAGQTTGTISIGLAHTSPSTTNTPTSGITFTVTLGTPTNAVLGAKTTATGTIIHEPIATISAPASVTVGPDAPGSVVFTVTLSNASASNVSVPYTYSGTAVDGTDYTSVPSPLVISAGSTSGTITVPITNTNSTTGSTLTITLGTPTNAVLDTNTPANSVATVNIVRIPDVTVADTTATVGPDTAGSAVFTISLSAASSQDVTVQYATADGTAKAGTDYTSTSGTATISANTTSTTVTVPVTNTNSTTSSAFTLTISSPTNAVLGAKTTATATITRVPDIQIADTSVTVGPDAPANATFTVTLSKASTQDVSANYYTSDGTAKAGTDYTSSSGVVTIPAQSTTGTITVQALNTSSVTSSTFTVTLCPPTNAVLGAKSTATGTIVRVPDVQIADTAVTVGPDASGIASFTVTTSAVYTKDVTVQYATQDGTAKAGTDYTTSTGTATVATGTTTTTITVPVTNTSSTTSSTFTVTISAPTNAVLGAKTTGTATITRVPSITISNATAKVGPTGSVPAVFTVTLSSASTSPVSVAYATANGTAIAGTDYTTTSGTLTIPVGKTSGTITVPVLGNNNASGRTFTVVLSSPLHAVLHNTTGTATITHDSAPVSVSLSNIPQTTSVGQQSLNTAVYSDADGATDITTAEIVVGNQSLPASSFLASYYPQTNKLYVRNSSNVNQGGFAPGSSNLITVGTGTLDCSKTVVTTSGNKLQIVWAITPAAALVGVQNASLNVYDSNNLTSAFQTFGKWTITEPGASIADASTTISGPSNGTITFTVTLSQASGTSVSVNYATADGTATNGTDYDSQSGTLTFAPGVTTQTFTIPVLSTSSTSSSTFTVTLTNPVNTTITRATATGTINRPDIVSVANTTASVGSTGTRSAVFTVSLSRASSAAVTVNYATSDGTAKAGTDYTTTTGTLTIPAGQTAGTVSVPVQGNKSASGLTFNLTLTSPSGATLGTATATATITHLPVPTTNMLTPTIYSAAGGVYSTLTATYGDTSGAANIGQVLISIGNQGSYTGSLLAEYYPATNKLYLRNTSGAYVGGFAPGSNNVISTGTGAINCAQTTVTVSGNTVTVAWNMAPSSTLVGSQPISLNVYDAVNQSPGWNKYGTYTVLANQQINAIAVKPSGATS